MAVLVIIAISFKSISILVLLVASIEAAIAINMGCLLYTSGRRNLSPEQKRYLLGKQYEAEKKAAKIFRGNQYTLAKKSVGDHGDNPVSYTHLSTKVGIKFLLNQRNC